MRRVVAAVRRLVVLIACAVAAAAIAAPVSAAGREPPPSAALHALFEREFQRDLREFPEYATFVGTEGLNDRLSDGSPVAVARRKAHIRTLIAQLQRIDPKRLNTQDRISLALMLDDKRLVDAFNTLYGALPFADNGGWLLVAPNGGPQHFYAMLAKAAPFRHARDYDDYIRRLAAIPLAMQQMTDAMRAGMRSGWVAPRAIMARVPGQFDAYLGDDVATSPLFSPFASYPPALADVERARIEADGRKVLAEQVRPAFAAMKRFIDSEYVPVGAASLAATALPQGAAYYALAVRAGTSTTLTPDAVHRIGLDEVVRIGAAMDSLIAQTGFKGSRADYVAAIKADPANYHTRPDDMLQAYRDIAKRVDAELPRLFKVLPRLPYGIRPMEAYEGDNAEHYTPGALDGSRAGYFEANVRSLATRPVYEMENTFLHEAVPGHHLQIARAQEIEGLPDFRRSGGYNAYGEGWALYAESLGPELGLYKDPASRFGALAWEMVRACRLVVDTGLHVQGWTRERAIAYMVDNAAMAPGFAASEIDRYIAGPGQALGYKIGELTIRKLRARAQDALGDRFDIRAFHNAVLDDGPLPLSLLETRIDAWIQGQRAGAVKQRAASPAPAARRQQR